MLPPPPRSTLFPYTTLFRSLTAYSKESISERHRHRYEFNNVYRQQFEAHGMLIAGSKPDGDQHADRKSTRLNSSHVSISYAVFCLKKKKKKKKKNNKQKQRKKKKKKKKN